MPLLTFYTGFSEARAATAVTILMFYYAMPFHAAARCYCLLYAVFRY